METQDTITALKATGISRDFGPVRVLSDVDIELRRGEVHALIGENGAGKSTLVRILSGYLSPSAGSLKRANQPVTFHDCRDAEDAGIVLIHQELNLARHLTVEENLFLGREIRRGIFLDKPTMRSATRRILSELGTDIDPDARLHTLPVSKMQMVEIGKALERNRSGETGVLIMDEPTGVLTPTEAEALFQLIDRLRKQGTTIIYISHKLDEVKRLADRVTILRDGRKVATRDAAELSESDMANLMVGRELKDMFPQKRPPDTDDVALRVRDVSVPGWVHRASFELRKGEILGFAGLIGAGRTETMEGIMGYRRPSSGHIELFGETITNPQPWNMLARGIVYVSEDRKGKGILADMPMRPNVTLMTLQKYCRPLIDTGAEDRTLTEAIRQFDIRAKRRTDTLGILSGGNQQKIALAKAMDADPRLVILDEPTRGIDIGTKQQIYQFVSDLAGRGISCILISSELTEIIGVCHRVVVMRAGKVTGIVSGHDITEQQIMHYAAGVPHEKEAA